jgi:uncharacterized membrane protein
MELLILLVVLVLLGGLFIVPISFIKALSASGKAAELQQHFDRLELELNDTRSLCLQLRAQLREVERDPVVSPAADEPAEQAELEAAVVTATEPEPATETEPAAEAPEVVEVEPKVEEAEIVAEPPAANESTLRHLLDLKQQHQADEPEPQTTKQPDEADAAPPIQAETESAPQPVKQTVAAIEQQAAPDVDEPIVPPVSTLAPIDPYEPEEPSGRRLTIEEVLAGKVFVWIGAIALVLTAAFLLKLGFDNGIITEQVRVIAAGVFGLALWCVGEWARTRVSLIAQALCGAGVAVLYGTIIAAEHYELLGPSNTIAFALMGLVTAAAVVLSLRHGPAVAILGMLGGFMMPPLLVENMSPTLGMVLYLIAIEVGVLAVTGKRGWFGISLMTLIFSVVWSIGYTLIGDQPHERTLTAMLVLGTAAAYIFHTARIHRDPTADRTSKLRMLGLSIAATCSAIAVCAVLAVKGDFSLQDLSMLGVVALGTLVLARLDPRQIAMPFVAMAFSALVLLAHAVASLPAPPTGHLIAMCAGFGGLFLLGGYICLWCNTQRKAFATMCAIAGPAFYGIVFFAGHEAFGLRDMWWPYTLGLAGIYALATVPMLLRRKSEHDWPIAVFSVLSFALICITLGQAMDHPRFAVCLALVSAAAALIDLRLFIRPLRVAACSVAFISAGLLVVPGPFELTIHGGPVFNTLLPMYLLPAIAFGIIAWAAKRAGSETTASNLTWLCIATAAGMLLVLIRNIYQPAEFLAEAFHLYEWSTYATVLLLASFASHWLANKLKFGPILAATRCIVGIGAILALISGLIPGNPLFNNDVVGGGELAAGLLALYAAPAALVWLWSRRPSIQAIPQLAETLRGISITLITLFVALQIRNGFQGSEFQGTSFGMFECMAYAVAWLFLGGLMQWYNQLRLQSAVTRFAGQLIFAMGLLTTIAGSVFVFNPLLTSDATGGWDLAGRMVVLYALPAVLLWAWSYAKTLADQTIMVSTLRGTSIVLLALFVGLQIRNGFQSDNLQTQSVTMYECIAYMVAGLLLGGFIQRLNQRYLNDAVSNTAGQIIFYLGLATTLVGSVAVFNPLIDQSAIAGWGLPGRMALLYILPAALMWLWSRGKTLADQRPLIATLRGASIAFVAIFIGTLIRNAFHHDALHAMSINMFECATYGLAWAGLGFLLHIISPRCTLPQTTGATGRTVFGVGVTTLLLGNVIVLNPLWFRGEVGLLPVFNGLWYLYGPLIAILALLARHARKQQRVGQAKLAGFMAVGLSFMLLSMFVRHGFAGDGLVVIASGLVSAERYGYSLAWVVFGAVLLVAGVLTRLDTLRYGSLAVLLLAVGKVFLIDTANLDNLYRVFSFFGLGVTLIGLGYLYQRLVFKRPLTINKPQAT